MTEIKPCGVTIRIEHNGRDYFGHFCNDAYDEIMSDVEPRGREKVKVEDEVLLFDHRFNKIPYDDPLYVELVPHIEGYLIR